MFGLYMFGSTLENLWGPKRFFIFYMLCGIGAGIIQLLANYVEITIIIELLPDEFKADDFPVYFYFFTLPSAGTCKFCDSSNE